MYEINTSCENVAYFGTFNECFARTSEAVRREEKGSEERGEEGKRGGEELDQAEIQLYLQCSVVIIIIINIMIIVLDSLLPLGMGADSNRDCLSVRFSLSPPLSYCVSVSFSPSFCVSVSVSVCLSF